jgi:serine/threonine protein kinase
MAHLVAEGPEPGQTWCRELAAGATIRLGRSPESGWDVAWDNQISREHADLIFNDDLLTVRQVESARNPIHFDGESTPACALGYDETFRIGQTEFRLIQQTDDKSNHDSDDSDDSHRIGDYVVSRLLGTGGMGSVYLARHTSSGHDVALKVLGADQARNPELVRRFQLEGQLAQGLRHQNLVEVLETGVADNTHFIAQEFIDGADISQWLVQRGTLPLKRTISIIRQVAEALAYLHRNNIIHRDVKPSNLLMTRDGTPRLADMGVARSLEADSDSSQVTQAGAVVGTIDYIAPEQADDSHSADARSDIYSLGCTWYEMLTGSPPFPDGGLTDKINAHATQPPPNPRNLNPDVPEALVAVLDRMMAKSPNQRHQSIEELLDDIATDTLMQQEISSSVLAGLAESSVEFQLENNDSSPQPDKPLAQAQPLVVRCGHCRRSYKIAARLAGKRLKCRECGEAIEADAQ